MINLVAKVLTGFVFASQLLSCDTEEDFTGGGGGFSATVFWTAPTTNESGAPLALAEISGYRVYYGTSPGAYSGEVAVSCSTQECEATLTGIPSEGTYYYVITTIDTQNRESTYSAEQSVTI